MPPSRPLPRWSTPALCGAGLAVALLGYAVGRGFLSSESPPPPASPPSAISALTSLHPRAQPASSPDGDWEHLAAQPNSPARAAALAAILEKLARTDPKRALALAQAEGNWAVRDQLRDAALRGWGATAPDAAADWAMDHRLEVRMQCMNAVLTGAAENPQAAVRVALRICQQDPEPAADYGHALISALVDKTGDFNAAVKFAAAVGTERQEMLLDSAYYQWARHQPEQALGQIATLTDPKIRASAKAGLLSGWADADAQQLAQYAQKLPPGEDRTQAFATALPRWVERDPTAATQWIGGFDPSPDLDAGVAAVASLPSLITQKPEVAMDWAGNITDRAKRIMTKHDIFTQWAGRDLAAARRFAETSRNADDREMMIEALNVISATR